MAGDERMKLGTVQAGMTVYDADGTPVGAIEEVYAAVADPTGDPLSDAEMAGQPVAWASGATWAESLERLLDLADGETFSGDEARRIVQDGFMLVAGEGLAGKAQLVGCYQVADVRDDGVYLRPADEIADEVAQAPDAEAGESDLGHDQHG